MKKQTITFKLISQTNPDNDNCTQWEYQDEKGQKLVFRDYNEAWSFGTLSETNEIYQAKKVFKVFLDTFVNQGMNQHDYDGGYNEAISVITIRV